MVNEYKLQIGSYGWQYESWKESFYPEDLPTEWQFGYYANEYTVIMIPWKLAQDHFELVEQGLENSEESCRLLFELSIIDINSNTTTEILQHGSDFLNTISVAGSRCLGIIINFNYTEICSLSDEKLDCISEVLTAYQSKINTSVDLLGITKNSELPEKFMSLLSKLKIELCRYNETRLNEISNAKLYVTYCEQSECSPKEVRAVVENSLLGECEASTNVLIFRSESPRHEQMNTASVICDLL